ncbi:MAG: hypothetical protein JJD98_02620 [Polaromonas sp.]|nr:hypothetical protein [Polaromonas sp.]
MKSAILTAIGVIAIAIVLSSAHLLGPDDNSAEWDQSENLKALQATEAGTARREAAAQSLCNEARGPNSEARWLEDGSLACSTRKGMRAAL